MPREFLFFNRSTGCLPTTSRRQIVFQNISTSAFNGASALPFLALANAAVETGEKIMELNMRQVRTHLEDSSAALTDMLSATDPQSCATLAVEHSRQSYGKLVAHFTELAQIASSSPASMAGLFGDTTPRKGKK
jgi:phasin family protein